MPEPDPIGRVVQASDIAAIQDMTRRLRAEDYRYGGEGCLDVLLASLPAAHALLDLPAADAVTGSLRTAVADLHNLAGWMCFDTGLVTDAVEQFGEALRLARLAGDSALVANVHYRLGRLQLHHDAPGRACAEFQLGTETAQVSGSPLATAILCANLAWATARMGLRNESLAHLARAHEEFAHVDPATTPGWAHFFTANDLTAISGVIHTELARTVDPEFARSAVPMLSEAVAGYGPDMNRSKAFSLISLATSHLVVDEVEQGVVVGHHAVDLCQELTSVRTLDRLRSLRDQALRRRTRPGVDRLVDRIGRFQRAHNGHPSPTNGPYSPRP